MTTNQFKSLSNKAFKMADEAMTKNTTIPECARVDMAQSFFDQLIKGVSVQEARVL